MHVQYYYISQEPMSESTPDMELPDCIILMVANAQAQNKHRIISNNHDDSTRTTASQE